MDAHTPQHLAVDRALQVGRGLRVAAGGQSVLVVVQHPDVRVFVQRLAERGDRTVAMAHQFNLFAVVGDPRPHHSVALDLTEDLVLDQPEAAPRGVGVGQVLVGEDVPHLHTGHLAALVVGVVLDHRRELDLQPARQFQFVLGAHDVGHATLAGLGIDPDHGFVCAAHILGVDRQVRHLPGHVADVLAFQSRDTVQGFQPLVDRVLM